MTNTNEDRIKGLAEKALEEHAQECRENPGNDQWDPVCEVDPADLLQLLSDKQALERENERLNDRNVEVSMLAHQWMVAHDNRAAGLPVTYPSPADVPSSMFLLALMAACAESAGVDPDTGEQLTWRQVAASITGSLYVAKQRADRAEAALTAAQERVGELEKGLKPFADLVDECEAGDDGPLPDQGDVHLLLMGEDEMGDLPLSAFLDARALLTPTPRSLQGPGIGGGVS